MKKLACLLACVSLVLSLTACGGSGLSDAEIRDTVETLVEQSYVLNDVYYGDGLPYEDDEDLVAALLGMSAGSEINVNYMPVSADAPFASEEEIREATAAVFSPEMCEILYEIAFTGVSTEDEEKVAFARYIQQEDVLTVRLDLGGTSLDVGRTYDFDNMTVLIDEVSRVRVEIPSFVDGEKSVNVRMTVIKTADGWRLDSPTY